MAVSILLTVAAAALLYQEYGLQQNIENLTSNFPEIIKEPEHCYNDDG